MASVLASKIVDEAEEAQAPPPSAQQTPLRRLIEERRRRNVQLCCLRIDANGGIVRDEGVHEGLVTGRGDYERLGIVRFHVDGTIPPRSLPLRSAVSRSEICAQ